MDLSLEKVLLECKEPTLNWVDDILVIQDIDNGCKFIYKFTRKEIRGEGEYPGEVSKYERDRIALMNDISMLEIWYQEVLKNIPYFNWLFCKESKTIKEAGERMMLYISVYEPLEFISRFKSLSDAFKKDFKTNLRFYKTVIPRMNQ